MATNAPFLVCDKNHEGTRSYVDLNLWEELLKPKWEKGRGFNKAPGE